MSVRDEKAEAYMKDRKLVRREGYQVIFSESESPMPLCCSLCTEVMRTRTDEEEYRKHGCCASCAFRWAYPRIVDWNAGWRPSSEELAAKPRNTIEFTFKFDD